MFKNRSEEEHNKITEAKIIRSLPLFVSSKDDPEEIKKFELGLEMGLKHTLKSLTSRISTVLKIAPPIPQFFIQVSLALLVD